MLSLLAVVVIAVPIAEIYLLIQLGHLIGGWATLGLMVADAVLGWWLFKRAGLRAWRALQQAVGAGRIPGKEIADGALVLAGATLLVIPGLLTDLVGVLCVLPVTRPLIRRVLQRWLAKRVAVTSIGMAGQRSTPLRSRWPPRSRTAPPTPGPRVAPDVVEGEVIE